MNLADFFHMDGYWAYVWPAYGICFVVLVWNVWSARRAHEEARRLTLRRLEMEENRQ